MSISLAERRQIENEMIFRRSNEKVSDALDALDAMYVEDGHLDLTTDEKLTLHFVCECSDENCVVRIPMLVTEYQEIHVDRKSFIVVPDHQDDRIEKVLQKTSKYNIVRKNNSIGESQGTLNSTETDNI